MIKRIGDKVYVVRDTKKYLVNHPTNGDGQIPGRQLAQIAQGDYGDLVREIYEAQEQVAAPHRFAWRGIINSLGDFSEVLPPTNPTPL